MSAERGVAGPGAGERPRTNGRVLRPADLDPADPPATVVPAAADAGEGSIPELAGVAWRASYDRESVDAYLAAVEAERERLLDEIRFAEERAAAAQEQLRANTTGREARLGALVLAARDEIDRLDREHRAAVAAIRAQAEDEAARLRERAQADAAAVREVVASLSAITTAEDATDHAGTTEAESHETREADEVDEAGEVDEAEEVDEAGGTELTALTEVAEVAEVDDATEQTRAG